MSMDNSVTELLSACDTVDKERMFLVYTPVSEYYHYSAMHQSNKCYVNLMCPTALELHLCTFTHWHR